MAEYDMNDTCPPEPSCAKLNVGSVCTEVTAWAGSSVRSPPS